MTAADVGRWSFLPCLLLCLSLSAAPGEEALAIGYLRAEVHAPAPLAPDATTSITYHLTNISDSPVNLLIDSNSYQPLFVRIMTVAGKIDPAAQLDVWGPDTEETLIPNLDAIMVSGVGRMGTAGWLPTWPARSGIILLKDEGYARIITFLAGWIAAKDLPQGAKERLVVSAAPPLRVALPRLVAGAVSPGRPIDFDADHPVLVPGNRLVPFRRSAAGRPKQEPPPPAKDVELRATIEISHEVVAGKDVVATYLIGNVGNKPVWLMQNALVPALATWELSKDDKVIATIDGSALAGMTDLLPERAPLLLNPGEYLTYQRVLLASVLPLKRAATYTLQVRLDAPWFATEPTAADQPTHAALLGTTAMQVR